MQSQVLRGQGKDGEREPKGERGAAEGAGGSAPRTSRRAQTAAARSPAAVTQRLNYILVNIDCGHLLRFCAQ